MRGLASLLSPQQTFQDVRYAPNEPAGYVLDRKSLKVLSTFGGAGRWAGQFYGAHNLAVNSKRDQHRERSSPAWNRRRPSRCTAADLWDAEPWARSKADLSPTAEKGRRDCVTVTRRLRSPDLEYQPPPNNFIWSCYSRQREIDNVTAVLTRVVCEYETFIRGNAFRLEKSPYLDPSVSIVFEYVSSHDSPHGPGLREWHLRDPHRALERTSILDAGASKQLHWPRVEINNMSFEVAQEVSRSVDFLFANCPLSHLIYRFLANDLNRQYQM